MHGLPRQPDEAFLAERRRLGHDRKDELWDGVLHMVPPASFAHGNFTFELAIALRAIAKRRQLVACCDGVGVFEPGRADNYRVPDALIARPHQVSKRGVEGALLVVEVLSPKDDSRDKLPFYAKLGVSEVWLVDPETRAIEILALRDGDFAQVLFVEGITSSPVLGIEVAVVDGPRLRLGDGDESHEV